MYKYFSVVLSLSFLLIPQQTTAGQKKAIIIGNSSYVNVAQLPNTLNDVYKIDSKLRELNFDTLKVINKSKKDTLISVSDFIKTINEGDTVVFYYAGHGLLIDKKDYLIPIEATIPEQNILYDDQFIDFNQRVVGSFAQSKAETIIFILDSCRNDTTRTIGGDGATRSMTRPPSTKAAMSFLYSVSEGQKAADGKLGGNSPFAEVLASYLLKPNQSWAALVEDVIKDVKKKSQQDVWFEGNPLGKLILNPKEEQPKVIEKVVIQEVIKEKVVVKEVEKKHSFGRMPNIP